MRIAIIVIVTASLGFTAGVFSQRPAEQFVTSSPARARDMVNNQGWRIDRVINESGNAPRDYILVRK